MIGRLRRALDWRVQALAARLDESAARIELVERGLEAVARRVDDAAGAATRAAQDAAAVRAGLEHGVQPVLRAVVAEESENRRRLFSLRGGDDYEAAFSDPRPLVSITLPTSGRGDLLVSRALPSLLAQTYEHIEVCVAGDAAPPEVADAVAALGDERVSYANLTQRITAHPDPARHWLVGSTMARNEATRRARGRWLLHFDHDDRLRPDAVAGLLALARERRAEVAYGGFEERDPGGGSVERSAFPPRDDCFGWQGALVHGGLRFFERELVAADLGLAGDAYMLQRMLRAGVRFAMLDRVVWDYYPSTLWAPSSAASVTSHTSSTTPACSSE